MDSRNETMYRGWEDYTPFEHLVKDMSLLIFAACSETDFTREQADQMRQIFHQGGLNGFEWAHQAAMLMQTYIDEHMKTEYKIKVSVPSTVDVTMVIKADSITEAVDNIILEGEYADGLQSINGDPTCCSDIEWFWDRLERPAVREVDGKPFDPIND